MPSVGNFPSNSIHLEYALKNKARLPAYLLIDYASVDQSDCSIYYQLFYTFDDEEIKYVTSSKNYIGSYSISIFCDDKFKIPLTGIFEGKSKFDRIKFIIIPYSMDDKKKTGIEKNFKLSFEPAK